MTALLLTPLAAGLAELTLALWLFRASWEQEGARAFGFVLVARGLSLAALSVMMVGSPSVVPTAGALYCGFCLITVLGVVHFVSVYPARRRWRPAGRVAPVALLLAAPAIVAAVLVAPHLAVPDAPLTEGGAVAVVSWMLGHPRGVIGIAPTLLDLMMAVPAFALIRDYRHAPPGRRRDTYLIVSLGFFAPAACSCLIAGALLQLRGATPRPADPSLFNYLEMGFFGVWFIVVSALLGFVAMQAVRARVERQRRDAALFGLIVVVSTISGAIAGSLPDVAASITAIGVMVAGWSTLGAALVGWGILRYSLFDIDIKLKVSLQRSTVAAVFVAVYFLVSEVGAVWFSDVSGSDYWGIAAAALLLLALHPLQGATERVFDGLMPAARPLGSLDRDQQVAFYREQVDLMWMDGHLSPKDRLVLANLRVRLGLDTETAEAVELAVIAAQHE